MTKILHIDTSPMGDNSYSRRYSAQIVKALQDGGKAAQIVYRDLAEKPLPHLTGLTLSAFFTPADQRSDEQRDAVRLSDQLVSELQDADTIVLGVPMWNFGIPSVLKAWIDHVARAGITFRYTANGPEGLLKGKKVIIASARGGVYSTGPAAHMDHQEQYLIDVLGFIGITDVSVVRAEGLNLGAESVAKAVATADAQLSAMAREPEAA